MGMQRRPHCLLKPKAEVPHCGFPGAWIGVPIMCLHTAEFRLMETLYGDSEAYSSSG